MRKKLIAGNWKMNFPAENLVRDIKAAASTYNAIDVLIIPPTIFLSDIAKELQGTSIKLGAQNFYPGDAGAFTGEIAGPMLTKVGCQYVLVGHSERRQIFHEDLDLLVKKFQAAQQYHLIPILCVGETLTEREQNQTQNILQKQICSVLEQLGPAVLQNTVIAYEPVWAIGTGKTAAPEQAEESHAFIRALLAGYEKNIANQVQILYGGSVKADNAAGLFKMPNIDGALIGGASLDAKSFLSICQAAII